MRNQAKDPKQRVCRADSPCIDDKVALTQEGFESFAATYVLGCEKWKPGIEMRALSDVVKDLQSQGAFNSH